MLSCMHSRNSAVLLSPTCGAQVLRCNGQDILNVKELMRIVESSKEPYLTFELEYNQARLPFSAAGNQCAGHVVCSPRWVLRQSTCPQKCLQTSAEGCGIMRQTQA